MSTHHIDISICADCLMIVANDDDSGIEDPTGHRANMARHATPGMDIVLGGMELGFCTSRCDSCGEYLHGDRYRAYLMPA